MSKLDTDKREYDFVEDGYEICKECNGTGSKEMEVTQEVEGEESKFKKFIRIFSKQQGKTTKIFKYQTGCENCSGKGKIDWVEKICGTIHEGCSGISGYTGYSSLQNYPGHSGISGHDGAIPFYIHDI